MIRYLVLLVTVLGVAWAQYTEPEAAEFLVTTGNKAQALGSKVSFASWDNDVNYTDATQAALDEAVKAYDDYQIEIYPEVVKFPWENFTDPLIKRQFRMLDHLDEAALSTEDRERLGEVLEQMGVSYTGTVIKEYNSSSSEATLSLEDVQVKIADSEDACEKAYYWDGWQTQAGRSVKTLFEEYVQLENKVAVLNGFKDTAERWQSSYETEDFEALLEQQLEDIMPLFQQLHAYIRRKLWLAHGQDNEVIDLEGAIPASLLGSIWGMDGIGVYEDTTPYPEKASVDVTPALESQNYTGLKLAQAAEQFYVSLGFDPMTDKFYEYSIFEKPADRDNIDCSDISYNFFNGEDYRIKMCTNPTQDDWGRMHYQMGLIVNYMQWKDLPWLFQDAPNPAFSSLTGDTMYLYVTGPTHLQNVGLLDSSLEIDEEQTINALYYQALSIVFFLPYAYSLDLWRWRVFQGQITPDNYNCEYWKIRLAAQGVEPPVDRDENDFDPGAKSHVVDNYQYILYFVSGILEFQVHNALCEAAGHSSASSPVYLCDIYNSTAAGEKLKIMLALGKSHPWPDALEKVTGSRTLDAKPLLTFFQPLYDWLVLENSKTNEKVGWTSTHKRCYGQGETKPSSGNCRYS